MHIYPIPYDGGQCHVVSLVLFIDKEKGRRVVDSRFLLILG